jgi:hypothetical protein
MTTGNEASESCAAHDDDQGVRVSVIVAIVGVRSFTARLGRRRLPYATCIARNSGGRWRALVATDAKLCYLM